MGFIGTLLGLGQSGGPDGSSFASRFGSLFQTKEQQLIEEGAQQDMSLKRTLAENRLQAIAAENLDARDSNPIAAPINRASARSVGETTSAASVELRTQGGGPSGWGKA